MKKFNVTVNGTTYDICDATARDSISQLVEDTITRNYVFAAPYGQNGAATFRALNSADLPVVPISKGGTGHSSNIGLSHAYTAATDTAKVITMKNSWECSGIYLIV